MFVLFHGYWLKNWWPAISVSNRLDITALRPCFMKKYWMVNSTVRSKWYLIISVYSLVHHDRDTACVTGKCYVSCAHEPCELSICIAIQECMKNYQNFTKASILLAIICRTLLEMFWVVELFFYTFMTHYSFSKWPTQSQTIWFQSWGKIMLTGATKHYY